MYYKTWIIQVLMLIYSQKQDILHETYTLFRKDAPPRVSENTRPFGGTAVYSCLDYYPGYPQCANRNGIEITILRFIIIPPVTIVGVYRSPAVSIRELCSAIKETVEALPTQLNIFIGDFNVNWFNTLQRALLYNLFIRDSDYRQLVTCCTTDSKTCIDHIYTNLPELQISNQVLETYVSDHKAVCVILDCFNRKLTN